jgi:glycosyltransferase involved in cell wall biosynthesis
MTTTEASRGLSESLSISVVIPNFNYAEFLGDAIESALNLDWPAVQVIVVDDGSTDGSRAVIERYRERIVALFQDNRGQAAACNAGFARAHGDVVIFLDSDDLLDSSLARNLAAVWRPGVSKVQFQMRIIDAAGRPRGSLLPQYQGVPSPAQIKRWVASAASYPTPPGSGNAYSRAFLERIFPLAGADLASDSYCLAAAPYLGDVLTIAKPLVSYRVHGRNGGAMSSLEVERFGHEVKRALGRFEYAKGIARSVGVRVSDRAFNRSLRVLPYRMASLRLAPREHPIVGDSLRRVLADAFRAFLAPQGMALQSRALILVWLTLVAMSPRKLGEKLVLWRFASGARPQLLGHLLSCFGVVKRS